MGDAEMKYHVPVLLNEVLKLLQVVPGKWYVDATGGGGGHTEQILKSGGYVLALDQDPDAIDELNRKFTSEIKSGKVILRKSNFSEITKILKETGLGEIQGILFDLGMSTHQIAESKRGFSYLKDEPLDMRMSSEGVTAREIVNTYKEGQLYEIFRKFGEEQLADPIVRALVLARTVAPIERTGQLKKIIFEVVGKGGNKSFGTTARIFQALRIAVNLEIERLKGVLPQVASILAVRGRLVVISFHSLEDRAVKLFMRHAENQKTCIVLTHQPIRPTLGEIKANPRARSAKMRAFEKI